MNIEADSLLVPVPGGAPAGVNMEYEQIYEEIRQARESDPDYLPQDEWSTALRKADWPKVIRLSTEVLRRYSKDMQIACWLVEAQAQQAGLTGVTQGVAFLTQFIDRYWQHGWPTLEEDGMAIRLAIFSRLDRQLQDRLIVLPLLNQPESTLEYWQKVMAYEHRLAMGASREALAEDYEDFSPEAYYSWVGRQSAEEVAAIAAGLRQMDEKLAAFDARFQQLSGLDAVLPLTRRVTQELQDLLRRLSERIAPVADATIAAEALAVGPSPLAQPAGAQLSRDLAIIQMLAIAHFFRQTEPSSPVPFLMERAARWANMTLTEWLEEMVSDDSALREINSVLTGTEKE